MRLAKSGLEHEQPEHLDRRIGLGDLLLHHLMLGDETAVRLAAERSLAHHVEGELALGDSAHGVMDAAAAESVLGKYLGAVFRAEQVVQGRGRTPSLPGLASAPHGENLVERLDLLLAEPLDPVELFTELRVGGEIPRHALTPCRLVRYRPPWQERQQRSRWSH